MRPVVDNTKKPKRRKGIKFSNEGRASMPHPQRRRRINFLANAFSVTFEPKNELRNSCARVCRDVILEQSLVCYFYFRFFYLLTSMVLQSQSLLH